MKGLMILIRKEKLDAVKAVLQKRNASGMTVTKVLGCGRQKLNSDAEGVQFMPGMEMQRGLLSKLRIDVIVKDEDVEPLIDAICEAAYTGKYGDGKIFIYDVIDAVRIRTKERGPSAV
ncbi:MAG: P-II family nitrogen regulator [Butyricicoccus sp.]|nr:P-II family nitrogen regulator [Butyricicoccus sp.]